MKNKKPGWFWFIFLSLQCSGPSHTGEEKTLPLIDQHVHLLSPSLIQDWKAQGITFSRADQFYADIDTILQVNGAQEIHLISMAYLYGSDEFYQGEEEYEKVKSENNYLRQAALRYPQRIRAYYGFSPLKEYAMTELKRCHQALQMDGIKLHFSSSQVYLTEPEHLEKVKPIFQYAAENHLPILLHFDNWHPKFGEPDIRILIDSVLKDIPPLHLTIAHLGSSGGFNEKTRRIIDTFEKAFAENKNLKKHRIFFDISAVALEKDSDGVPKLTEEQFEELTRYIKKLGRRRIVFGSDYPLYTAREYQHILQNRLGFTQADFRKMSRN